MGKNCNIVPIRNHNIRILSDSNTFGMILHQLRNSRKEVYVTILLDKDLGCINDIWTGPFETQENFKKGLETADLREMKGSWDFNRNWMVNELMPRAQKAGLNHEAIIIPRELLSKLSTVETISQLEGYTIRQFDDIHRAKEWLRAV